MLGSPEQKCAVKKTAKEIKTTIPIRTFAEMLKRFLLDVSIMSDDRRKEEIPNKASDLSRHPKTKAAIQIVTLMETTKGFDSVVKNIIKIIFTMDAYATFARFAKIGCT